MVRFCKFLYIILLLTVISAACKKDVLHLSRVQKLDSHTVTDRFNKILFVNDSLGFAAGGQRFSAAALLVTRNGGKDWEYQSIPAAGKGLYGISATPGGSVFMIGFDGKLLKSIDGGASWSISQLRYNPFKDIYFPNEDRGIVIGGISYHAGFTEHITADGTLIKWDSTGYELNDLEMINGAVGYLAGFGMILKTADSGESWQQLPANNDNFTAVHAYGLSEAWACGYNGSILHTVDGGQSWERLRNGNNLTLPRYKLLDICFDDALNGYAVGEKGLLLITDDGGHHWMEGDHFTDNTLRCIVRQKNGTLFVCGDNGSLYSFDGH